MVDGTFDNLTVNNVASINGNFYGWALFLNNGGININNDSYLKGDVRINNSPAANSDSHLYLKSKDASTTWSTHLYNYRDGNFVIDVSKNCIVDLSDAAGSSKFIIRDSAFAEVASINSDGQLKVMENFYAGGNYKVSINTSGELWFGNGSTWKNKIYYPNGTVDTLATNGNFAVEKQLKLSCACPYFSTWYGAQGLESMELDSARKLFPAGRLFHTFHRYSIPRQHGRYLHNSRFAGTNRPYAVDKPVSFCEKRLLMWWRSNSPSRSTYTWKRLGCS